MTTILALETSGSLCSVAVQRDAELFEDTRIVERLHNEVVLAMVDGLCDRVGLTPRAFDVVAFGAGPGSFTGVRIAAAVAQGIAFGAGSLCVPVASSRAMALAAVRQLNPESERLVTMTRSRRDAYYLAGYSVHDGLPSVVVADVLCTRWPAAFRHGHWMAVGDKPPWWAEYTPIDDRMDDAGLQWGGEARVTAALIAELGIAAYADGAALDPAAALPVYVQGDSPWHASAQDDG